MTKRSFELVRIRLHPNSDGTLTIHWALLNCRTWKEPRVIRGASLRSSSSTEQLDFLLDALAEAREAAAKQA